MTKSLSTNIAILLCLATASITYLSLVAELVPDAYALAVNFVLVPLILGVLGFTLLRARVLAKLLLMATIPVAHVLYFGADSAKPGLENMVAAGEYVSICVGVFVGALVSRIVVGRSSKNRA